MCAPEFVRVVGLYSLGCTRPLSVSGLEAKSDIARRGCGNSGAVGLTRWGTRTRGGGRRAAPKVWTKALQAELTVGVSSAMLLLTHNLSSARHY